MKNAVILLITGLFIAGMGIYLSAKIIKKLKRCTADISAICTSVRRKGHSSHTGGRHRTRYSYTPILSYRVNGADYSVEADISSMFPTKYREGQRFDIRYDPSSPENIIIKGRTNGLAADIFLIITGAVFVVMYFYVTM